MLLSRKFWRSTECPSLLHTFARIWFQSESMFLTPLSRISCFSTSTASSSQKEAELPFRRRTWRKSWTISWSSSASSEVGATIRNRSPVVNHACRQTMTFLHFWNHDQAWGTTHSFMFSILCGLSHPRTASFSFLLWRVLCDRAQLLAL